MPGRRDDPSWEFAKRLFARFPQWHAHASTGSSSIVTVPSPTGDPERTLTIWLEEGVPSVEYGDWHTHADLWVSEDDFLSFIDDIVSDRQLFLVVSTWAVRWSVLEEPIDEAIDDALTGQSAPDEVRIVSWSGRKDRIVCLSDRL